MKSIFRKLKVSNNKKIRIVLWAILGLIFIILPIIWHDIFLFQNANNIPTSENIDVGARNLWRIVFWFLAIPLILSLVSLTKKNYKILAIIFWIFWIAGTCLTTLLTTIWKPIEPSVSNIETEIAEEIKKELPQKEGEKIINYNWKYKGKDYILEKALYDSHYQFYKSLSKDILYAGQSLGELHEETYELFIKSIDSDSTIEELANSIKTLGENNKLNEDKIIELVLTFVQTIPYDDEKFQKMESGIKTDMYFPYEVLYDKKGVCSDKSFLAYSLIKELGYGVALFHFTSEKHMALGIKCPIEYSSYNSGYCFAETTSVGNKIGTIPELMPKKGIAVANRKIENFENENTENTPAYTLLTNIGVFNEADGKTYNGIIDTISTQREIERLKNTLYAQNSELKKLDANIKSEKKDLKKMEDKLDDMEDDIENRDDYEDYRDYYSKYEKEFSKHKKDIKEYNNKIETYNQTSKKYNQLINNFYQ